MQDTRIIMGMPVTVEIIDSTATTGVIDDVFAYFDYIDQTFSTFKADSEISQMNRGMISPNQASPDVQTIFALAKKTSNESNGYFDIGEIPTCDPSGIVKGWAIYQAAQRLESKQFKNFYINAGGDIEARGYNAAAKPWRVGMRHPFNKGEIVKVISVTGVGVASSGTYERGHHVFNPKSGRVITDIVSLTVIGPNIYEADRFATAAFAMGKTGIYFIEQSPALEGYMIDANGLATMTSNFEQYMSE